MGVLIAGRSSGRGDCLHDGLPYRYAEKAGRWSYTG